jgi:hypothetical protein
MRERNVNEEMVRNSYIFWRAGYDKHLKFKKATQLLKPKNSKYLKEYEILLLEEYILLNV